MKLFVLIYKNGKPYLREKNPLEGEGVVSKAAYDEHERLYYDSALPFPDPLRGRTIFKEDELIIRWQFREQINLPWLDISEPDFIATTKDQYRQKFTLIKNERYQDSVKAWVVDCFGEVKANNIMECSLRLVEEVMELVQALGLPKEQVLKMLVYTYGRPPGEVKQEFGGVMVTLAALAAATDIDLKEAGDDQLDQNTKNKEAIKLKHLLKIEKGVAQ